MKTNTKIKYDNKEITIEEAYEIIMSSKFRNELIDLHKKWDELRNPQISEEKNDELLKIDKKIKDIWYMKEHKKIIALINSVTEAYDTSLKE
jgi:hypothetical protein